MRTGLTLSILFHLALFAWVLLSFATLTPLKPPEPEVSPVSSISEDDLIRQTKGDITSKQVEAAPAPKPAPDTRKPEAKKETPSPPPAASEPPPPADEPVKPVDVAKAEPPKSEPPKPDAIAAIIDRPPDPSPAEIAAAEAAKKAEAERLKKLADEKAEAERLKKIADEKARQKRIADEKARQKRIADERARQDALRKDQQKKQFASNASDLISKLPDPAGAPASSPAVPAPKAALKGPVAGTNEGHDTKLSAPRQKMIVSMIEQIFVPCWRKPAVGGAEAPPVVRVVFHLTRDGHLEGKPVLQGSYPSPVGQLAADEAIRAVYACDGQFILPPEDYETGWHEIIWDFDPRHSGR